MARFELGSVPANESCVQLGDDDYHEKVHVECNAYKRQLLRMYKEAHNGANLPDDVRLITISNSHDFGTYHEVAVKFNDNIQECVDAAFWFEDNCPSHWDEIARSELELQDGKPTIRTCGSTYDLIPARM